MSNSPSVKVVRPRETGEAFRRRGVTTDTIGTLRAKSHAVRADASPVEWSQAFAWVVPTHKKPDAMGKHSGSFPDPSDPNLLTPEATVDLLEQVKHGDQAALSKLLERCIPPLRRWARGRLPQSARGMQDTADLVQDAVFSAMRRIEAFEARHQGALQAYLRLAVMNRIRDAVRQRQRRPLQAEFPEVLEDHGASPLTQAIGAENLRRYDEAIQRLKPEDREAIIGRLELQYSYEELTLVLNKPSAAAARMTVTRAMKRLADELRHAPTTGD
jgi:RNA polymerase sigma-70 factor (ECF subfamily)